jgi:hypothetical protein
MAMAEQQIAGSGNVGVNVGQVVGTALFGDVQVVAESQFFETNLDEFSNGCWIEPPAARPLVEQLADDHLLILAGSLDDKPQCARHLAYLLRQKLQGDGVDGSAPVEVREVCRGQDPQRIENAFAAGTTTVLLLSSVSPVQLAGYTPSDLRSLLCERGGYALLTTNWTRKQWGIEAGGTEARLWHELSWEGYYGADLLAAYLIRLLAGSSIPVPEGILPDTPGEPLLCVGLSVRKAVESLRTPGRVRHLARWLLAGHKEPLTRRLVEEQLAQLAGDLPAIGRWFRSFDARDQLLAVGLTLLDGLPEDLMFTGLEMLVETTWRDTDPQLPQFDHCDLAKFSAYFKEIETEGGAVRVQTDSRDRRQLILEVAWETQRRRLLASLPVLTEMIRWSVIQQSAVSAASPAVEITGTEDSVGVLRQGARQSRTGEQRQQKRHGQAGVSDQGGGSVDAPASPTTRQPAVADAFGRSQQDSSQLHQVLAEAFSLIGLLSVDVVRPHLLRLAADPAESVQQLVAGALAGWRRTAAEGELWKLLRVWWNDGCRVQEDSLVSRLVGHNADPWSAVRATVALIAGYAAQHDRANSLAPELYGLFEVLLQDRNLPVRRQVATIALPKVVAWHLVRLEPLLRTRGLQSEDLIPAVARGAAEAYAQRPEESLAVLDGWRSRARSAPRRHRTSPPGEREKLLAAVARTYGYVVCDERRPLLRAATIVGKLRSILIEEPHPFVRLHAVLALEQLAARDFESLAQLLQDLVNQIWLRDRRLVVEVFTRIYLQQRTRLPGGDELVQIGGRSYPIWIGAGRPLTRLEAVLYSWTLDESRPVVQQLAVDIFAALSKTAVERAEKELGHRQRQPKDALKPASDKARRRAQSQVRSIPLLGRAALLLACPRRRRVRDIVRPLLAELIALRRRSHRVAQLPSSALPESSKLPSRDAEVSAVLARWTATGNETTVVVVKHLRRALRWYRWRWWLIGTAVGLALLLHDRGPQLMQRLRGTPTARSQAANGTTAAGGEAEPGQGTAPPPGVEMQPHPPARETR